MQDMDQEDIERNEADLMEMQKSIRKLSESLKSYSFSEEKCDAEEVGEGVKDRPEPPSESEISAKMAEMEKFERVLKMKSEEVKTVRLKRMLETEEFTQQLKQLSTAKLSDAVKNNSEQLIRLLESEISEDTGEIVNGNENTKPTRKVKVEDPARRAGTFIERNIQLAKCGDGVLSLTDEEKLRLKIVLKDSENPEAKPADNEYVLSDHLKSVLREIDRKLEEHGKTKFPIYSIRNSGMKYEALEEPEKGKSKAKIQTGSTERKRLRELDKLLNVFNSATMEEINPLMDEDLQYLIEESKQCLSVSASTESLDQVLPLDPIGMPTKETMLTLVADARSKMPNFRFRYHP